MLFGRFLTKSGAIALLLIGSGCSMSGVSGNAAFSSEQSANDMHAEALLAKLTAAAATRVAWVGFPSGMGAPIDDPHIQANIDASIQGSERNIVALAMQELPPWQRTNVIIKDEYGDEYVNHERLRGEWRSADVGPNASGYDPAG